MCSQGVARGLLSLARLDQIHERLEHMMQASGARIAGIYFCPHGPGDGCDCRKPNLGLMKRASAELGFDMRESIVIGDKESDVEFGRRAGAVTMLVGKPVAPGATAADYVVASLEEAANIIGAVRR